MSVAQLFFSFEGRLNREPYWFCTLTMTAIIYLPAFYYYDFGTKSADTFIAIANLVLLWPTLAVLAKRWHDRDKSAWWSLIVLVPVIGFLWCLIENGFLQGTPGPNRFGVNPMSITNEA